MLLERNAVVGREGKAKQSRQSREGKAGKAKQSSGKFSSTMALTPGAGHVIAVFP